MAGQLIENFMIEWLLIVWLEVPENRAVHERVPSEQICLQKKARLEYYLNRVQSKMRVDCVLSTKQD